MMFEGSRWECSVCHKYTFAKLGEQGATCKHCGRCMSVTAAVLAIAANAERSSSCGNLRSRKIVPLEQLLVVFRALDLVLNLTRKDKLTRKDASA
jgi:hypothetical protein